MNLLHLRYFVELAHTRHYTKAAEHLCITQPSLSHAISQLEAELGVPLFEKVGRNTMLTRFGEQFLSCTERSLKILDEGTDALRLAAQGEGLIRLGLLRTLGVDFIPEIASDFLAANPDKDIHFTFSTGTTHHLLDGLLSHKFDLVFCSEPPKRLGLKSIPVKYQHLVLIVPKSHPLSDFDTIDIKATLPYPHVYFSKEAGLRSVIDRLFEQMEEQPIIAYEVEEDEVVAGLVSRNFGIAIVPYMDMLERLNVKIIEIANPTWDRKIYMVRDERIYIPPAVWHFSEFVMEKQKNISPQAND